MNLEIYTGNFGSGKTEIALNQAIRLARHGQQVSLIDLDIVKPYFRSREVRQMLEREKVRLVAPVGGLADADLPIVVPEVLGTLTSGQGTCIIDVGGDNLGATALGRLKPYIAQRQGSLQLVVNPYRPFTRDTIGVQKMLVEIEAASRLKATVMISNPNLGISTTVEEVLEGHRSVQQISEELGLPIKFLAVLDSLAERIKEHLPGQEIFPLENFMLPPWYLEEGNVNCIDPNLRLPQTKRRDD